MLPGISGKDGEDACVYWLAARSDCVTMASIQLRKADPMSTPFAQLKPGAPMPRLPIYVNVPFATLATRHGGDR